MYSKQSSLYVQQAKQSLCTASKQLSEKTPTVFVCSFSKAVSMYSKQTIVRENTQFLSAASLLFHVPVLAKNHRSNQHFQEALTTTNIQSNDK